VRLDLRWSLYERYQQQPHFPFFIIALHSRFHVSLSVSFSFNLLCEEVAQRASITH
jgi:hypothetical protein